MWCLFLGVTEGLTRGLPADRFDDGFGLVLMRAKNATKRGFGVYKRIGIFTFNRWTPSTLGVYHLFWESAISACVETTLYII